MDQHFLSLFFLQFDQKLLLKIMRMHQYHYNLGQKYLHVKKKTYLSIDAFLWPRRCD